MLSVIRLGYLLSLLMTPFADVFGRRRLLLYTVCRLHDFHRPYCDRAERADFRRFRNHCARFRRRRSRDRDGDRRRGSRRGLSRLGDWPSGFAVSSIGYGLAAIVFAFINMIPYGWRGMYAIALIPLAVVIPLRRVLPESARFEKEKLEGLKPVKIWEPLAQLYTAYPDAWP